MRRETDMGCRYRLVGPQREYRARDGDARVSRLPTIIETEACGVVSGAIALATLSWLAGATCEETVDVVIANVGRLHDGK